MGRGKGKSEKDPYEDLAPEFKEKINQADEGTIHGAIKDAALYQQVMVDTMKEDEDLKARKEEAREAGAIYREAKKQTTLKIRYCKQILSNRGKAIPGVK